MKVAVDIVALSIAQSQLRVLLIERLKAPFKGMWALPGGFVEEDESLEEAAHRELDEEAGVQEARLDQLEAFSAPRRDPRYRVITVSYLAIFTAEKALLAGGDAAGAQWHDVASLPKLAFDHQQILQHALAHVEREVRHTPLLFELLPSHFTLTHAQTLLERILRVELDKRNFRKKLLALGFVEGTTQYVTGIRARPAQLFRFNPRKFEKLSKEFGFSFC